MSHVYRTVSAKDAAVHKVPALMEFIVDDIGIKLCNYISNNSKGNLLILSSLFIKLLLGGRLFSILRLIFSSYS